MTRILDGVGLPREVLDRIPAIVQSCRECRAWQSPAADAQTTITTSERFNQHVEMDIFFYSEYQALHFIDR